MPNARRLAGRCLAALSLCLLLSACGGRVETTEQAQDAGPEITIIAEAVRAPGDQTPTRIREDAAGRAAVKYPTELFESSTDCFRLKLRAPYIGIAAIDEQIRLWEAKLRAAYVKEFNQYCDGGRPASLLLNYETSATFGNAISILFLPTVDTGGAHPSTSVETLSFDTRSGGQLAYEDIFGNPEGLMEFFSDYTRKALRPKLAEFWDMGEIFSAGLLPKPENFANFALVPEGLVLIFPPYQLAPYSEGLQSCLLPLDELVRFNPKPGVWH